MFSSIRLVKEKDWKRKVSRNEMFFSFREDAFQGDDTSSDDVRFEETNILYNLGAVYSKLGAKESKKNHDVWF